MDGRTIRAHATEQVLLDRIDELLRYRTWYRDHPWTVDWPMRQEHAAELRALVRLGRQGRARAAHRLGTEVIDRLEAYPADYWAGDHYVGMPS